jgi:hypothetical protein
MPVLGVKEDVFVTWAPWRLGVPVGAFPVGAGADMPGKEFGKEGGTSTVRIDPSLGRPR